MEPLTLNLWLTIGLLILVNVTSLVWAFWQYRKLRKIREKFLYPPQ